MTINKFDDRAIALGLFASLGPFCLCFSEARKSCSPGLEGSSESCRRVVTCSSEQMLINGMQSKAARPLLKAYHQKQASVPDITPDIFATANSAIIMQVPSIVASAPANVRTDIKVKATAKSTPKNKDYMQYPERQGHPTHL